MPKYVIDGVEITVKREFENTGLSLIESLINVLINIDKKEKSEEHQDGGKKE